MHGFTFSVEYALLERGLVQFVSVCVHSTRNSVYFGVGCFGCLACQISSVVFKIWCICSR